MPWFDRPLEQLREYRTETEEPPELDQWWQLRLAQARGQAREPSLTRYEADIYVPVEVYDAEFSGAGGDRIRAWYLRPAGADGRTQVVVKFIVRGVQRDHVLISRAARADVPDDGDLLAYWKQLQWITTSG